MRSRRICSSASLAKSSIPLARPRDVNAASARVIRGARSRPGAAAQPRAPAHPSPRPDPIDASCTPRRHRGVRPAGRRRPRSGSSSTTRLLDRGRDDRAPQPRQPQGRRQGLRRRSVLSDVTLGVSAGDRIGVVGRNGDGKSTLLRLIAGVEEPDAGAVTRAGGLQRRACSARATSSTPVATVRDELVGGRADHEWAADARVPRRARRAARRRRAAPLPGGPGHADRRRSRAASGGGSRSPGCCSAHPELLLLDEPTNHLDVEGVDWLARHLAAAARLAARRHPRPLVPRRRLHAHLGGRRRRPSHQYEGGYAAYVLARAERERQAAAREDRRQQLLRKELAWLRRGPPARTAKPKFRIEAANALIADEPEARDRAELLRFAADAARQEGARRRGRLAGLRRPRSCCATRPGASARATASRSSASTGPARRR